MALLSEKKPGDIVKVKENDVLVDFLVLQQGYSNAENGTLLRRKDSYDKRNLSSTWEYENSSLDTWLNNADAGYLSMIDSDIKNKILKPTIQYTNASGALASMERKVFLLSLTEVGLSYPGYANTEGKAIAYFADNSRRITRYNGAADNWWLRTLFLGAPRTYAHAVGPSGDKTSFPTSSLEGVCPTFVLPNSAIVLDTGELIFNQPPTVPTNLQVSSPILSDKPVTLNWTASTDPEGALAGYIAQRKLDSGEFTEFYRGSQTKCTDSGVPFGTQKVTYRVCAYDTENLQSDFVSSEEFTVVNNHDPVIDGEDKDLGELSAAPTITYTATDEDSGDALTGTITLDGVQLTTGTITSGQQQTYQVPADKWLEVLNGSHTIKITVTDQNGGQAVRTLTFSKKIIKIVVENTEPVKTDAAARRIVLTLGGLFSAGSSVKVEVCNNGFDEVKSWEDATAKLTTGGKYIFINDTKTAENWGVCWRITIERGSADGEVWISSGSGACDD